MDFKELSNSGVVINIDDYIEEDTEETSLLTKQL
jgi:hypothetical protein